MRRKGQCFIMFHQVQTWRAIRAMCTDSSLKEGHVYNHASNYLAVDYLTIRPVALSGYGSTAHEAKPNGLLIRGP